MVLLIKSSELTKNTPMGGNVDPDKYIQCIKDAQVMTIEPLLGTKLFDKILTEFAADTLAGDYLELVNEYIKPILIHSAFADYIIVASFTVANGGVYKHQAQDSQIVDKGEIDYLAQNQRNKAQVYIERCERFLCDKDIPEYDTQDNDYDVRSQDMSYMGGWKLGGNDIQRDYLKYKNLEL